MSEINNELIQEAYYGKLPEFAKIETLLESIIQKIKKEPKTCNPNKYGEMKEVQKLFTKVFGFKKSIIYWEPFNIENAYTYSINTLVLFADKKKPFTVKTERGFYDNTHSSVLTVYLSVGLIVMGNLTARELLACILHEIGHNFDRSGYHMIGYWLDVISSFGLNVLVYNKYKDIEKINDLKLDAHEEISTADDELYSKPRKRIRVNEGMVNNMKVFYKCDAILATFNLISNIMSAPFMILLSPLTQILSLAGKKGELFADSFSTAYGYGTDLITALNKMTDRSKYYNPKSKICRFMQDLAEFQWEVYIAFNDVHGSNEERCIECKKKLVNDLRTNDFPPELKKELILEIEKINNTYKQLSKFTPGEKYKITKIWRKINQRIFRGSPALISKLFKSHKV